MIECDNNWFHLKCKNLSGVMNIWTVYKKGLHIISVILHKSDQATVTWLIILLSSSIDVMVSSTMQVCETGDRQSIYIGVLRSILQNKVFHWRIMSETDPTVHKHLYTPKARNISCRSQNDIIKVTGQDYYYSFCPWAITMLNIYPPASTL